MIAVPADTPATTPAVLIEAIAVLLLLQVPPETPLVSAVVAPAQTVVVPLIVPADGVVDTLTVVVALAEPHALVTVYDIVTEPTATPVTTPVLLIVAIEGLLLLQVPPVTALINVLDEPGHTVVEPVMVPADGVVITVTVAVVPALPQLLVTV